MVWASGLATTALPASSAGQAVAERHRERVVPGRDDADDALGDPVDLDPGERRERRRACAGCRGARGRCARSSGRSARCAAARRTRACGPCRTPSTIRSMISSCRSSTRSCSRSSIAARSSSAVRAHAAWAPPGPREGLRRRRRRSTAGCAPAAPPLSGESTCDGLVRRSRRPGRSARATYSGSRAYDAARVVLGVVRALDQRAAGGSGVLGAHAFERRW